MNKLILAGALLASAIAASPAAAAVSVTQSLSFDAGSATFSQTKKSTGLFTDVYTFSLADLYNIVNGGVATNAIGVALTLSKDIDFTSIILKNLTTSTTYMFQPTSDSTDKNEHYILGDSLTLQGDYSLSVSGNVQAASASSGATYLGELNVLPAVPEPATWALMLFGFGAVGYSLRRKKHYQLAQAV